MNLNLDTWLEQRRRERKSRKLTTSTPPPPIPEDLETFLEQHVTWPDEATAQPVKGLTPITRDWIRDPRRTTFRYDEDGLLRPGYDIFTKPRKVKMTSCVLGCIQHAMLMVPGSRWLTILHTLSSGTGRELYHRMMFSLANLPAGWCEIENRSIGSSIKLRSMNARPEQMSSEWLIATAGSSADIAAAIGRGGTIHGIHLSEAAFYREPSEVWAAATNAGPTGRLIAICESTFNSTDDWFYDQYRRTQPGGGGGAFLEGWFYPWFENPDRRISETDERYSRVMTDSFVAEMDPADLLAEENLELSPEQKAWRRWNYCRGRQRDREKARRENPEDDISWASHSGDGWFDVGAINLALADCREPAKIYEPTSTLTVYIYGQSQHVVAGIDCADRHGDDYSATVFLDHVTRDVVAVIHGKALASEHAEAIEWTLRELGVANRYTLCPERNKDFGLIGELEKRRLRMFQERVKVRDGRRSKERETLKTGVYMGSPLKRRVINLMGEWLEGENGNPSCKLNHRQICLDIRAMKDTGKPSPEAVKPDHDDLADAWGIALWLADKSRPSAVISSAPSRQRSRRSGSRH